MLMNYIAAPLVPIRNTTVELFLVEDSLYSQRLSQLLNTWWLVNAAPFAVIGNFSSSTNGFLPFRTANSTDGSFITGDTVLQSE